MVASVFSSSIGLFVSKEFVDEFASRKLKQKHDCIALQ